MREGEIANHLAIVQVMQKLSKAKMHSMAVRIVDKLICSTVTYIYNKSKRSNFEFQNL